MSKLKTIYVLRNVNNNYDILCETEEIAKRQLPIEVEAYKGSEGWDDEDDWEIDTVTMKIA